MYISRLLCGPAGWPAVETAAVEKVPVIVRVFLRASLAAALLVGSRLAAQGSDAVTNDRLREMIRQSGLSVDELRRRAAASGMDPAALQALSAGDTTKFRMSAPADANMIASLTRLGIISPLSPSTAVDSSNADPASMLPLALGIYNDKSVQIFGSEYFSGPPARFESAVGLADPSYRLGVGDALQVIMTGDVEQAYQLDVRPDGSIILPRIGVVPVSGLSIDAAAVLLRQRGARVYSGLSSGRIRLDLSIARARQNLVYLLGEVGRPGPVRISSLGTAFQAIAAAGGPTKLGSYRTIELRRAGRLLRTLDLYAYLLTGDGSADVRLEQGDVLFVPVRGAAVSVMGEVRRERQFELRPAETLRDALRFAGGLTAMAATNRLQIDRILPPGERKPGKDRSVVTVEFDGDPARLVREPVRDEDVVTVFPIDRQARNVMRLEGAVFAAGRYEWRAGMTLGDAIALAKGLTPWAITTRIKVARIDPTTKITSIRSVDFTMPGAAATMLEEYDVVTVLDARVGTEQEAVDVSGAVNRPRSLAFATGMTLQDAVDLAGGVAPGAQTLEIARIRRNLSYSDTLSVIARFELAENGKLPTSAARFPLLQGDQVALRLGPGSREARSVELRGLFSLPGAYTMTSEGERLSNVVARAGGVLPTAFPESFRLVRRGRIVSLSFDRALAHDPEHDLALEGGDELSIGPDSRVVIVSGAVARPAAIPFRANWDVQDYVDAAGGVREDADRKRLFVEYQNGLSGRTRRTMWLFRNDPPVRSGSVVTVPAKPPSNGSSFRDALAVTVQATSALTSILIAVIALRQ